MEYWFDWNDPSGQYDLSPDGGEIAFAGSHFDADRSLLITSVFTMSVATGAIARIEPEHPGDDLSPRYSPDGRFIVHGRTMDPEFYADRTRLMRYDRTTHTSTEWLAGWDLSPAHWSFADDGTLVFEAEQDARVRVFTFSGTGVPKALTDHGTVSGTTWAKGGRVVFTQQSLAAPSELFVAPLAGGAATRLTRFTDEVTARFGVGEVREMRFAGCEGEPVQMFVVLPPGYVITGQGSDPNSDLVSLAAVARLGSETRTLLSVTSAAAPSLTRSAAFRPSTDSPAGARTRARPTPGVARRRRS